METICIKMESNLLSKMNKLIDRAGFSTKTEFIREAIRDKIEHDEKQELIKEFLKFRGKAKKNTTYAQNRKTREQVSKELMAELEKRFN